MNPLNRRAFITRLLGAAAATALPVGHVATAIAHQSEPEPFEVAPGVHVVESPSVQSFDWDVRGDSKWTVLSRRAWAGFSITANADGSGQVVITTESDNAVHRIERAVTINLNASQFSALWEGLFANHYEIVEAHALPAGCNVDNCLNHATLPIDRSDVERLNREPHNVIVGGNQAAREHGFDRIIEADFDQSYLEQYSKNGPAYRRYGYWYAVKLREVEPHWPALAQQ